MIFSFVSLAIALIALILYFGERSKFLNKTDELTADIQKEMEEKLDIQSRYNTLVNDIKKEEEFTKSKKIDEEELQEINEDKESASNAMCYLQKLICLMIN